MSLAVAKSIPGGLVLDGNRVKVRCEQRQVESQSKAVVDYVRGTFDRARFSEAKIDAQKNWDEIWDKDIYVSPNFDKLPDVQLSDSFWDDAQRKRRFAKDLREIEKSQPGTEAAQSVFQAHLLAVQVCEILGPDFQVADHPEKGHDFFRYRIPILLNGSEVACVYCWSVNSSDKGNRQRATLNVNIPGTACTFARPGWEKKMAEFAVGLGGKLTTCHLAVDFFNGLPGGIDSVYSDYLAGVWDHLGKRPIVGDISWLKGHSRSLYLGSKECGKQTNWYEKGDQLFSEPEAVRLGIKWLRCELRWGNKFRVLDWDMLVRPADFFAGASQGHADALALAQQLEPVPAAEDVVPESVPVSRADAPMSVMGEVVRNVKYLRDTALASMTLAFKYLDADIFTDLIKAAKLPGRLKKFSEQQIKAAFDSLPSPLVKAPFSLSLDPGQIATYSISALTT
jgi:phage replication initiation protein